MRTLNSMHNFCPNGLLFLATVLFLSGCGKGTDPLPTDENELITTVTLRLTPAGTSATQTVTYQDRDGAGGTAPTRFDALTLTANTSYSMTIEVLDESKTPAANITNDIRAEQDDHLFVYTADPAALLTYTYGDRDSRNFPVGLVGTVRTGAAGTGKLNVRLLHQPPVNGVAVKNGTTASGTDDVNLDFTLTVR